MVNTMISHDLERCPHCNMDLHNFNRFAKLKHMARCVKNENRRMHSGRPPGRPTTRKRIRSPEKE